MATKHTTTTEADDIDTVEADRLRRYYLEHMGEAVERCLAVDSKYTPGRAVPWKLNVPQKKLFELWDKIEAWNLKQTTAANKLDPRVAISRGPVKIDIPKARQGGISSGILARLMLRAMWTPNYKIGITAHKLQPSQRVFAKATSYFKAWRGPLGLWHQSKVAGKNELAWAHGSTMTVSTAGSEDSERGSSFNALHFSEAAYFASWSGANAALDALTSDGVVIYESTGNGDSGPFYDIHKKAATFDEVVRMHAENDEEAKAEWNGVFRLFISWLDDPGNARMGLPASERKYILNTLSDRERIMMEVDGATVENLAFRRDKLKGGTQSGVDPEEYFDQEFPTRVEDCFRSRGSKFFLPKWLDSQARAVERTRPLFRAALSDNVPPVRSERKASNLRVFEPPQPGHFYIAGGDAAEGLPDGDYSVCRVFDRTYETRRLVAHFRSRSIEPTAFADVMCILGEWYHMAWLINESQGAFGRAVSQRLIDNAYPYLYFEERHGVLDPTGTFKSMHSVGYPTHGPSRGRLLSALQMSVRDGTIAIIDEDALEEYKGFETRDGKAQAPQGGNDDCVIADALVTIFADRLGLPDAKDIARAAPDKSRGAQPVTLYDMLQAKLRKDEKRLKKRLGKAYERRPPSLRR